MLHLADRLLVVVLGDPLEPPVAAHLGVQEVLVDADEFTGEHVVQGLDDLLAPLHATSRALARLAQRPRGDQGTSSGRRDAQACGWGAAGSRWRAMYSRHEPQSAPAPSQQRETSSTVRAPWRTASTT